MELLTVLIAEKEHIDSIQEFNIFLKPFIDTKSMVFCEWDPEGETLEEAVPTLVKTVSRQSHWRAVVVCDDGGLYQKNPFDRVHWSQPAQAEEEPLSEYCERVFNSKEKAFRAAAQEPLTRLMTFLCASPEAVWSEDAEKNDGGILSFDEEIYDPDEALYASAEIELAAYNRESRLKEEIRRTIVGDMPLRTALPDEVFCLARRTFSDLAQDLKTAWDLNAGKQYSHFYDWNLYFDRMRYLVFDIVPKENQNYTYDYIRFLCTMLLLARHGAPQGTLSPNRVYSIDCANDEEALCRLMVNYDAKLRETSDSIEREICSMTESSVRDISDNEVLLTYCADVNVPVTMEGSLETDTLFADPSDYGMSYDCPTEEDRVWASTYERAAETMHRLFKQPRRGLGRATESMRGLYAVDMQRVKQMNRYQISDVQEHIRRTERSMLDIQVPDLFDTTQFDEEIEKENKKVRACISTRMTKRNAILLGVFALVVTFLGFLPLIVNNASDPTAIGLAFLLCIGTVGLTAVAGLLCLKSLQNALRRVIEQFNSAMRKILGTVESSMSKFSQYLGCMCTVIRGESVLNYYNDSDDLLAREIRVRRMHQENIREAREILYGVFGIFMNDLSYLDPSTTEPYPYDFSRQVELSYPLPFTEHDVLRIGYFVDEYEISVPVDFIRRVTVRLEELYE